MTVRWCYAALKCCFLAISKFSKSACTVALFKFCGCAPRKALAITLIFFFFFTFHVAKILLEKRAYLKWLRTMAGSLTSHLSVVNVWHPAKQGKQQLSASAVGHGWTLTSLRLKLAIN